jgi:hypothetical protein
VGKAEAKRDKEGISAVTCSIIPPWKYSHPEQVVSQVLLQLQSPVFDVVSVAFGFSARSFEQAVWSITGEQHLAGQAEYKTPARPVETVASRAMNST